MAKQRFTVAGPHPAYNTKPGSTVELDPDDPLVQANVANGVLSPAKAGKPKPAAMKCPACVEQGVKPPIIVSSQEELTSHYDEAHPGLVAPAYTPEEE